MKFFEVFELDIDKTLADLYQDVEVERVVASRSRNEVKVYLQSRRIISYKNIKRMEQQIKRQLFGRSRNTVAIYDNYSLSAQYTPEKLFTIIRDSLLEELKSRSIIEFNVLNTAEVRFEDNKMFLKLKDSFLVQNVLSELKKFLEDIFVGRFNMQVHVNFELIEVTEEELEDHIIDWDDL